jgi:uncharacterized protein YacL
VSIRGIHFHWGTIGLLGGLIVAILVGVAIGGGTGTTITAIAAAVLALLLLSMGGGIGVAAHDRLDRRGRNFAQSLDEEERDRERREHPE